ncbi:LysM peptidoglycan-binding domain-containing protein [Natroniella sulfidigena]|uniref:LysM peptidoglycan-binding domain-containing protein n=1 Tax=Natroniella sulfidigena TaxID=723921 RepID=UPI00200AE64A|nr:LysM domain-containing protein [Natroniella sulfidigena]MCK8817438.1 LysM peptidoglycan-binding domain-containing protein [Natroniella sulfidigena]
MGDYRRPPKRRRRRRRRRRRKRRRRPPRRRRGRRRRRPPRYYSRSCSVDPPCPAGSRAYRVQSGDTFYSIARRLNTTVDRLRTLNPGVDPTNLGIGDIICVPE